MTDPIEQIRERIKDHEADLVRATAELHGIMRVQAFVLRVAATAFIERREYANALRSIAEEIDHMKASPKARQIDHTQRLQEAKNELQQALLATTVNSPQPNQEETT